jgi:hypothetical protein
MDADQAMGLWVHDQVEIKRSGAAWVGKVVGIIDSPSLILEQADGTRVSIALDGATATPSSTKEGRA